MTINDKDHFTSDGVTYRIDGVFYPAGGEPVISWNAIRFVNGSATLHSFGECSPAGWEIMKGAK